MVSIVGANQTNRMSLNKIDSRIGFDRRLSNYFERIRELPQRAAVIDALATACGTPEAQDTVMRFITERCGIDESEAAEGGGP